MSTIKRTIGLVTDLRIREQSDGRESRTIEGYALKFGVRSRLLCDWWDDYREVLEPGCITLDMLREQDIKLTMFHDRQILLARSNKGQGTLSYELDETGVRFWAEMPYTADGEKALELVKRGDIAGCSFCYSTDESDGSGAIQYERVREDGVDILLRHVLRIEHIYDFTLAADPAYEQTTVSRREVEERGVDLKPTGYLYIPEEEPEEEPEDEPEKDVEPEEEPANDVEIEPVVIDAQRRETIRAIRERISRTV